MHELWNTPFAEGCFMIGRRNSESLLQCNTFLRTFDGSRAAPIHWCIDPGSQIDYPEVKKNLLGHIGDLMALQMFSINHQDPDVVGNLTYLTEENPHLAGLVTEDVWRLVRHMNLRPRQLYFANKARRNHVALPNGKQIVVVATPFCHFRGAMAFYDPETQVLFSGDLFAGLNQLGRVQMFGEEVDWPGIAQFHQIYMPCKTALEYAIRQIRALQPAVRIIAPQHGFLLKGDFMHVVMDRLEKLDVGLDLLASELDERYLQAYAAVLQEVLHEAGRHLGKQEVHARLLWLPPEHELKECLHIAKDDVRLICHGIRALPMLVDELGKEQFAGFRSLLKSRVLQGCTERGIPLPQMGIGIEEAAGV